MWVVCNWQVSASSERSLVLRAYVSEPPIHAVSPQPADFCAAAAASLPHCFILHTLNLFKIYYCCKIIQRFGGVQLQKEKKALLFW